RFEMQRTAAQSWSSRPFGAARSDRAIRGRLPQAPSRVESKLSHYRSSRIRVSPEYKQKRAEHWRAEPTSLNRPRFTRSVSAVFLDSLEHGFSKYPRRSNLKADEQFPIVRRSVPYARAGIVRYSRH